MLRFSPFFPPCIHCKALGAKDQKKDQNYGFDYKTLHGHSLKPCPGRVTRRPEGVQAWVVPGLVVPSSGCSPRAARALWN